MATDLTLVIANKTYSSWSLRPWLAMVHFDVPFDEIVIPLHQDATSSEIRESESPCLSSSHRCKP